MESENELQYIYGPVPSRRLGFSLGIDVVPYKTCSFNCVYCQLGRTTNKTVERKEYFPKEAVLRQVEKALFRSRRREINSRSTEDLTLTKKCPINYVTFSGSGEPTLNSEIGWLIREISKFKYQKSKFPVAVLTNGSLLYDERVREDLLGADLVIPSLDAASDKVLEAVNRPHLSLSIEKIVKGLKEFRKEHKGKIWLEVMLVKGVNDDLEHISLLKSRIKEIEPDKVQLNTVVRPPSEDFAYPLSLGELERIRDAIGENCEVIAGFKRRNERRGGSRTAPTIKCIEDNILALLKRRPVTVSDMSNSLGIHKNELLKYLDVLEMEGRVKKFSYQGGTFYEPK